MPGRDRHASELRAVAPLIVAGAAPQLVGTVMLVANGPRVVGVTSAELLRPLHGAQLAIVTKLDGSTSVPVTSWGMGRYSGIGLVELGEQTLPVDHDITPLSIGDINASVNVHGAPAAIVAMIATAAGYERVFVPVHVDVDDGAGMTDHLVYLASPDEPEHAAVAVEGSPVFAWLPPDPALGRLGETVAFALAYPYRAQVARPRDTAVIAELAGLEDLGRALMIAPA
ncbi:MAG: hypothetical protein ABI867_16710, partial [Kofleriaceae bacterium]